MSSYWRFHLVIATYSAYSLIHSVAQRQPSNITRAAGENDVFIPCPFEFRPSPSIWRINGTDYTFAALPSNYSLSPGGLFINTVYPCLNHTSFQCIDTSDVGLVAQESSIGYLTVTSPEKCTEFFQSSEVEEITIDHQRSNFGNINFTLAWNVSTYKSYCNVGQVLSYPPCDLNNVDVNLTNIPDMEVTLSSDKRQISGKLADFNISSSNLNNCPNLLFTVRINVTKVELLNLLYVQGRNSCKCVDIECHGSLYVAISNPGPDPDILCPIAIYDDQPGTCYNSFECNGISFFSICQGQQTNTSCTYKMCFGNITEQLDGTKLDFYVWNRTMCGPRTTMSYMNIIYVMSFEIHAREASVNVTVDTSGEICFSTSSQDCSLTHFTKYNISVADLTRNIIFANENVPESTCIFINFLPQCAPFSMTALPQNEYIVYSTVNQQILSGGSGDLCTCLVRNVHLYLNVTNDSQSSSMVINYFCSSVYLTKVNITVVTNVDSVRVSQRELLCSDGSIPLSINRNQCKIEVCGYWTYNGSTCPLQCFSFNTMTLCPTVSPMNPGIYIGIVIAVLLGAVFGCFACPFCTISAVILIFIAYIKLKPQCITRQRNNPKIISIEQHSSQLRLVHEEHTNTEGPSCK